MRYFGTNIFKCSLFSSIVKYFRQGDSEKKKNNVSEQKLYEIVNPIWNRGNIYADMKEVN